MNVAVFGSAVTDEGHPDFAIGEELGRLLAGARHTVMTGGYGGLMEAVSRGAAAVGGYVVGVTASPVFPGRVGANRFVGSVIDSDTLPHRIHTIVDRSDAAIALPGSIGTLAELVVAWNAAFVTRFSGASPKPVITIGSEWDELIAHLARALNTDGSLVRRVATPIEAMGILESIQPTE